MSAEHTPGPWEQVLQNDAGPMIAHRFDTGKQMNPTGLRLICHMFERGNSLEQDKANAALVASAPELLAALSESVKLQSHYAALLNQYDGGNRKGFADAQEWIDRLNAMAVGS